MFCIFQHVYNHNNSMRWGVLFSIKETEVEESNYLLPGHSVGGKVGI